MAKKVTFNGIELTQSKYDKTTLTIFDYLDNVKSHLEKDLDKKDENFQFSVNVDFISNMPPKYKIHAGSTTKRTKEKIARILKNTKSSEYDHVSGSVKVNFVVEGQKSK